MKHILAASIAIIAAGILPASRSLPPETRGFIYSDNKTGHGSETITRDGTLISGDMVIGENHAHYEGRVAADGTVPRLEIRAWGSAAEATRPRVASVVIGRDGATLIEHLDGRVDTSRFASRPGTMPIINPSVGLAELIVARARSQHARSVKIPILYIDALKLDTRSDKIGAAPQTLDLTFLPADTVRVGNGPSTDQMRLIVGADGRIRDVASGSTATDKFSARPAAQ